MGKLVIVLSSTLALVCVGGCIPIGVKGSTMAGLEMSPHIAVTAMVEPQACATRHTQVAIARSSPAAESQT